MNTRSLYHHVSLICLAGLSGLLTHPVIGQNATAYTLPGKAVFPESIGYQAKTGDYYVGSLVDGSVIKGNINTKTATVFLPAGSDGRKSAAGMKIDDKGRLFIAAAESGKLFVYQVASRKLLGSFQVSASKTVVNDIAIMPNGDAYITDTSNPMLYRVQEKGGKLAFEEWLPFAGTAVTYQDGYNINGIVGTADGRYLIVVQTNVGKLFRIDTKTKAVQEIPVKGVPLVHGDGIALDGHTLYVARNVENTIVTLTLSPDFATATEGKTYTDPAFRFPTALAKTGNGLLIVNAQLNRLSPGQQPELPFTLTRFSLN